MLQNETMYVLHKIVHQRDVNGIYNDSAIGFNQYIEIDSVNFSNSYPLLSENSS